MADCDNVDRNIINMKANELEVKLSNGNWVYFEGSVRKGVVQQSRLSRTDWTLQKPGKYTYYLLLQLYACFLSSIS